MSTACRMRPATTKPTQQQGSIDGSINRFRGGRARRRARRVSRLLPVPPHEVKHLANSPAGDGSGRRQPAPLPGHPLPTTGLGGREVAFERRVMEVAVELEKRVGRIRQLTERDRELCGFFAVCRYLTREQVERLMFPGRSKARSSTRLRQLAASVGGQAAVLRGDLGFGSADGWTTVW